MTSKTFTITIGRNVGDTPMSRDEWNGFIDEVGEVADNYLLDRVYDYFAEVLYTGSWGDTPEDAFLLYGPLRDDALTEIAKYHFMLIRMKYKQEAIGFNIGESELI